MAEISTNRVVLFAKDLNRMADFYAETFAMQQGERDEYQAPLRHNAFELVIHQIPPHIAESIEIATPPEPREGEAVRLDYVTEDIENSRKIAHLLGGKIDPAPPGWADAGTNFYLGYDPEGNVFGVSQQG